MYHEKNNKKIIDYKILDIPRLEFNSHGAYNY